MTRSSRISSVHSHSLQAPILIAMVLALVGVGCTPDPESTLAQANSSFASGDYRTASIQLQNVLGRDAANASARVLAGRIAFAIGDVAQAREQLERARDLGALPDEFAAPLANCLIEQNRSGEALDVLELVPIEARGGSYWITRGRALVIAGDANGAEQALAAAQEAAGESAPLLVERARLAVSTGDAAAADAELTRALAIDAMNAEALILRSILASNDNRLADAEADLSAAENIYESRFQTARAATLLLRLVQVQLALNQLDAASDAASRVSRMLPNSAYADYANGLVVFRRGDFQATVRLLQIALTKIADQPQFMALLGAAHLAAGNFGQAEQQFQSILRQNPADPAALRLLAETRIRQQRPRAALETLQFINSPIVDQDLGLLLLQSAARLQNGNYENAIPYLEQAVAIDPGNQASVLRLVLAYTLAGRRADAEELLRSSPALTLDEAFSGTVAVLLSEFQARGVEAARAYAQELITERPRDARARMVEAIFHELAGETSAARESLQLVVELDPTFIPARLSMAAMLEQEGRLDEAEAGLLDVLEIDSRSLAAYTSLARIAVQQGDLDSAESYLREAVDAVDSIIPRLALARLYLARGDLEQAETQTELAESAEPRNGDVLITRGMLSLARGNVAEALEPLGDAATQFPNRPSVALLLAQAQVGAEDFEAARATLNAAVGRMPEVVEIRAALGAVELQSGDSEAALRIARQLQLESDERAAGYALEGRARMIERRYDDAKRMYTLAYDREPTWELLSSIVSASRLSSNPGGEVELVRGWVDKTPGDVRARLLLADLLNADGQEDARLAEYRRVIELDPNNVVALNNAAWFAYQLARPEALEYAMRAADLAPDNAAVLDTFGWILTQEDRAGEAVQHLAKAAQFAPEALEIRYHLAVAQAQSGQIDAARETLSSLLSVEQPFEQRDAARALLETL